MLHIINSSLLAIILSISALGYFPVYGKENATKESKIFNLFKKKSVPFKEFRFRDFPLVMEFDGDKQKLREYTTNVLYEQYKATPNVFSAAITYGLALIDLGELDKAKQVFDQAEKDFFANDVPKVYKAWVLACLGNYKEAEELWYPIVKQKLDAGILGYSAGIWLPQHIDSVVGLSLIQNQLSEEKQEEIGKLTGEIVSNIKSQPKLVALAVVNDLSSGNINDAKSKIKYLNDNGRHYPLLETLEGVIKYMEGDFEGAKVYFDNVTNLYSPINHLMKARTLIALGEKEEAVEEIDQALILEPTWEEAKQCKEKILSSKKGFFSSIASLFSK